MPERRIGLATIVVRDYDDAIRFYVDALGFTLVEDTPRDGKRWVVVSPSPAGRGITSILLAQAADEAQADAVGKQTGGRVALFLETDDFERDYAHMSAAGVTFLEQPRHEAYGSVVVFEDCCGNRWDLIQPA